MLLSIVMTILLPILSGRVIVVPNTNRIDDSGSNDVGVFKSLENLFFGGSKQQPEEEGPAGYYDENGYYHSKA